MADQHPAAQRLSPRSPFDGLDLPESRGPSDGAGVAIRVARGRSATLIAARPGSAGALGHRLREAVGITLPEPGQCAQAGGVEVLWQGPARWLVLAEAEAAIEGRLRAAAGSDAAVIDQSGALVSLRLQGSQVRAALAKMLPIDLHPRAFPAGAARSTTGGHIGVHVARPTEDQHYMLLIPRSSAADFLQWLVASSAEFGVTLA